MSIRMRGPLGIFVVRMVFRSRVCSRFRLFIRKAEVFVDLLALGGAEQVGRKCRVGQTDDHRSPGEGHLVDILDIADVVQEGGAGKACKVGQGVDQNERPEASASHINRAEQETCKGSTNHLRENCKGLHTV